MRLMGLETLSIHLVWEVLGTYFYCLYILNYTCLRIGLQSVSHPGAYRVHPYEI
jgi:hypothetical protein